MYIQQSWTDFKSTIATKKLEIQYRVTDTNYYHIWASENGDTYECRIEIETPASADQQDFEDNYKPTANAPVKVKALDKREIIRAESRPIGTATCFTMAGDIPTEIGGGKVLVYDFGNTDDDITAPTGFKRKRIEFSFIDEVWIKEGTVYFFTAKKGSYVDFFVVCPDGEIYLDNDGVPQVASGDTSVNHYVIKHHIQGDVPMGDELNTEAATENSIPSNYKFWVEVTVPDTDVDSNGYIELELYRKRSEIL